jgi:hypothetical protein
VSFRLMDETSATLSASNISQIANRINLLFPRSFFFRTGRYKISYKDKAAGYELRLPGFTPQEGEEMVKKILDIRQGLYNGNALTVSQSPDTNFAAVETQFIAAQGKTVRLPQKRQITKVYLDRVEIHIFGNQGNEVLIDRLISHRRNGRVSQYL